MGDYKDYLNELLEPLYPQTSQVIKLKRDAIADELKKKVKASAGGMFSKAKRAKKAQADLARKVLNMLPRNVTSDDDVIKAVTESKAFYKGLKTKGISKEDWKKAKTSYENLKTETRKKIKDKWAYIAGTAKKISKLRKEDAEGATPTGVTNAPSNMPIGAGQDLIGNMGGSATTKSADVVPGKTYPPVMFGKVLRRRVRQRKSKKESFVLASQYIDNLFE